MKTIGQQLNATEFPFELYDSNGNKIYFEGSNGYWIKREYDSKGNQVYFKSSSGYWEKKQYDSNGNEVYCEDSNGYIEDNRPKDTLDGRIIESDGKKYKLVKVE